MDAEIIAVLTPERLKELLEGTQPSQTTSKGFCYCCFTKEGTLYTYYLKTFALMHAFEVQIICLCYVCKQLAKQAEQFIEKVQSNQSFFTSHDNSPLKKPGYDPLKCLTAHAVCKVDISEPQIDIDLVPVKPEIEETTEQFPEAENNYENKQLLDEENMIIDDDVEKNHEAQERNNKSKILSGKIMKITLTRAQLMSERAKKALRHTYALAKFKCTLCVIGFKTWKKLDVHMDMFHSLRCGPFECDICQRRKLTEEQLLIHKKNHFERFKCSECGFVAWTKTVIKGHYVNKHTDEPPRIACPDCGDKFYTKWELHVHKKKNHPKLHKEICKFCNSSKKSMALHNRFCRVLNNPEIKHTCEVCGKSYYHKFPLTVHMTKHQNSPQYHCELCKRWFVYRKSFIKHSSSVKHVKKLKAKYKIKSKFHCDYCGKMYLIKDYLRQHISRIHLKNYNVPCKICGRKFFTNTLLQRHTRRLHDFKCEDCGLKFSIKSSYLEHRLSSHIMINEKESYECKVCNIQFKDFNNLTEHDNTVHGKPTENSPPGKNSTEESSINKTDADTQNNEKNLYCG